MRALTSWARWPAERPHADAAATGPPRGRRAAVAVLVALAACYVLFLAASARSMVLAARGKAPRWAISRAGEDHPAAAGLRRPLTGDCAFVYLVRSSRLHELTASLRLLFAHFNDRFRYEVLLFYDSSDLTPAALARALILWEHGLAPAQAALIRAAPASLRVSSTFDAAAAAAAGTDWVHGDLYPGYQSMVAFWFSGVLAEPALANVSYYWRLDTDSYLMAPVIEDVFAVMKARRYKYGYRAVETDPPFVTQGLWAFLAAFVAKHGLEMPGALKARFPRPEDFGTAPVPTYYNNIEVVHAPTFRGHPGLARFAAAAAATDGVFWKRWGDAPLRFFGVQLALDPGRDTYRLCALDYKHAARFRPDCGIERPHDSWAPRHASQAVGGAA